MADNGLHDDFATGLKNDDMCQKINLLKCVCSHRFLAIKWRRIHAEFPLGVVKSWIDNLFVKYLLSYVFDNKLNYYRFFCFDLIEKSVNPHEIQKCL